VSGYPSHVVVIESVDNHLWSSLMQRYWPRIYKYLDKVTLRYSLATLDVVSVGGPLGNTTIRPHNKNEVDVVFHPALLDGSYNLLKLVGTLAHEGLHAILCASAGQTYLPFAQSRRLVETHWVGRVPTGYGERLLTIYGNAQHPAIELLTNKLLLQNGFEALERGRDGLYLDTAN